MWFGDMVTMRWWDDLWLNEAFADVGQPLGGRGRDPVRRCLVELPRRREARAGYAADMAPTTHPIRQPVIDVAAAAASFDGITYPKGASVLKQLFAFVGEDACVAGLRSLLRQARLGKHHS